MNDEKQYSPYMRAVVHLGFRVPCSANGVKESLESLFFHHLGGVSNIGVDVAIDDSLYDQRLRTELQDIWTTYYNTLCEECHGGEAMTSCQSCQKTGFRPHADFQALALNMPRLFKIIDTLRVESVTAMGKPVEVSEKE